MPISTNDFASLTDDLQEIFNETAANKIAELKGFKLFDVSDTERRTYDYLVLHGLSGIKKIAQGADLERITSEEGDTSTWTQARYGAIASITKDMRKFDLYDQITSVVESLTEEAFDLIDQDLADTLTYGWSTSHDDVYGQTQTSTAPDGLSFFSTAHTNNTTSTTFSNVITSNPALSRSAIVTARAQGKTYSDPNGLIRPINLDTLIVSPTNEDLAKRIAFSEGMSGVADNDINPLKGQIKQVIALNKLKYAYHEDIAGVAAELIGKGKIIGWFQGRLEYGPRALGNRSILCNPVGDMKDVLNANVKNREWYRPFAPVVRLEDASKYFDFPENAQSRHMTFIAEVRDEYKEVIPAVTHEDGTARLQTVTRHQNEFLYDLITEFSELSDHAVLLNTSFNVNGKPILSRLSDALEILQKTKLDAVYY